MTFPTEVSRQLEFYVYRLLDPRNGETLYVGKGKGDRVFAHVNGALKVSDSVESDDDAATLKQRRILEIMRAGLTVVPIIHTHGIEDEATAYRIEAAVMDCFPGLANRVGGHGSTDYGSAHVSQVIARYAAPELTPKHRLLLINVGRSSQDRDPYEAVRAAWRLNPASAEQQDYVLGHAGGIVIGVFKATSWMPVTPESFPGRVGSSEERGRWGFEGTPASADIASLYIGSRVPPARRGAANPIRYLAPE
jgi:uncharacterized protein